MISNRDLKLELENFKDMDGEGKLLYLGTLVCQLIQSHQNVLVKLRFLNTSLVCLNLLVLVVVIYVGLIGV